MSRFLMIAVTLMSTISISLAQCFGGFCMSYYNEAGSIVGGIVCTLVVSLIGIAVGMHLSKSKPNEKSICCCCCCKRSVAILTNIVAFSVICIMFYICLSATGVSFAGNNRFLFGCNAFYTFYCGYYLTVPVILGCFTIAGALSTLGNSMFF